MGGDRNEPIDQSQTKSKIRKYEQRGEPHWCHFDRPNCDENESLVFLPALVEAMKRTNSQELSELLKNRPRVDVCHGIMVTL